MTELEKIIDAECPIIYLPAATVRSQLIDAPRPSNGDPTSCWVQAMPGIAEPTLGDVSNAIVNVQTERARLAFIDDLMNVTLSNARRNGTSKADIKTLVAAKP